MQVCRECVVDLLSKVLDCDSVALNRFDNNANLEELGLDSVNIIKLIVLIEEEYKFEFDEMDLVFENMNTIEKLRLIILKYI